MGRIHGAVDQERAILPRGAARIANVEIFDHDQLVARNRRDRGREIARRAHHRKMIAAVMAGRTQQERKREAAFGERFGGHVVARHQLRERHDHVGQRAEPADVVAHGRAHRGRMIDHG